MQVYWREKWKDKSPPLTHLHPEIEFPKDTNPVEASCEELARESDPQLIFTNLAVASHMLSAYWMVDSHQKNKKKSKFSYSELYFDLITGMARSEFRKV